jgi:hypothetical protein
MLPLLPKFAANIAGIYAYRYYWHISLDRPPNYELALPSVHHSTLNTHSLNSWQTLLSAVFSYCEGSNHEELVVHFLRPQVTRK